ncbi:hypothetical protein Golob_017249 [Gossypium lobatum]|uniref:MalT-like TPR region domain-containing protein n=1 Tax=Gossypium lobatum TaxID=34289 RepID=A0A7J8M6N4_9ROSI|nr:hypothetical protein [Gossypium lobatum]
MLRAFKDMEACFDERDVGLASLKIGLKLDQEGEDPEKALSFADKALKALDQDGKPSILVAMALQLMGSVNYSLKRFNDSLGYLNRANKLLGRLEEERVASVEDIRPVMHAVQLELGNVKTAMGRREEALGNLKKALEIKEITLENDCKELGVAYRDLAEAYASVLNFKEALPFGLKALEIHRKELGNNSVEVAHDRRILGVIYTGMEEHEKALEQNELSQKILKNWGLSSELLRSEIDAANMQIALGKYDEAINTLKGIVQQTDKDSEVPQAIPYLESAAEILKESFGSKHFGVGYIYNNLGAAYLELDRPQSAAQMFAVAKDIMDVSLGPHHVDSIETCQNLSKAYSAMGSYPLAIEFQLRVVDAWEGHGASAEDELREAQHILEELKTRARCTSTNQFPTKALPLPQHSLASRNSHPNVSFNQNSAGSMR